MPRYGLALCSIVVLDRFVYVHFRYLQSCCMNGYLQTINIVTHSYVKTKWSNVYLSRERPTYVCMQAPLCFVDTGRQLVLLVHVCAREHAPLVRSLWPPVSELIQRLQLMITS